MSRLQIFGLLLAGSLVACSFDGATGATAESDASRDVDAAPPADMPMQVCPADYANGYRLVPTLQLWIDAERDCEDDAPGRTHLVVVNDDVERMTIGNLVQGVPGDAWMGVVRDPGGEAPWPWRYVTGEAATYVPFEASEPNNVSGNQYVVVMRRSSLMFYDYGIDMLLAGVCECDGMPPMNADYEPSTTD